MVDFCKRFIASIVMYIGKYFNSSFPSYFLYFPYLITLLTLIQELF